MLRPTTTWVTLPLSTSTLGPPSSPSQTIGIQVCKTEGFFFRPLRLRAHKRAPPTLPPAVKFKLAENEVEVSGGGLSATYSTIQFHFHWGDTEHHPGSEHTVDGLRYPMEAYLTFPCPNSSCHDSSGIAVLGLYILSLYCIHLIQYITQLHKVLQRFLELAQKSYLTKFYRYMGSLTTPSCNEAVVWTVFQQPINISKNLVSCTFSEVCLLLGVLGFVESNQVKKAIGLGHSRLFFSVLCTVTKLLSPKLCQRD
uniref:carbonic anhydrase n=1 Tax=Mola mola TaxID=94237 RepID=A0A3Q3VTI9_MOLML